MAVTTRTHTDTRSAGEMKFTQKLHSYALQKSPRGVKRKLEEQLECEKRTRISITKQLKVARRRLFRQQLKMKTIAGYY